jgi:uncharacterized protein
MSEIPVIDALDPNELPRGETCRRWLEISSAALGSPVLIPVLAARGRQEGPVLGVTAALHGNELNGVPVVQRVFQELDPDALRGTVVGVPVLNVPSFLAQERIFPDAADLNRIMPGRPDGGESDVYTHRLLERLLTRFQVHLDLHTASFGRINSHYVRADMSRPDIAELARVQNADIIVNSIGERGTLRQLLGQQEIACVTVELGDPHVYQSNMIERGVAGVRNTLRHLGMIKGRVARPAQTAVECSRAYWLYTDRGGLLDVLPDVGARVEPGEIVARLTNVFGDEVHHYTAPEAGIVVGKSVNPVNRTGGRILHLGIG